MVKYLIGSIIFISIVMPLGAEPVDEQIKVAFTADTESIVGFSDSGVSDISTVTQKTGMESFAYNPENRNYGLEKPFYAFAQIFTTDAVDVKLKLNPLIATNPVGDEVPSIPWSATVITDHDGAIVSNVITTDGNYHVWYPEKSGAGYPRVEDAHIVPFISTEDVDKNAGQYTHFVGSIAVMLEVKGESSGY